VEQAGLAVFVTDADGIIEYVNPAFEKITGYDRSDVIGRTPGLLDADDDDPTFDADLLKTVFDGESWQGETTHYRQSGEEYHASLTVTPITDRNGHVVRLVAIQEDITEKKHSKRHLKVLNRFLRHNHRNLLNLLVGTAQSLERRDEGTVRMLEQTSSELDELSEKAYAITEVLLEEKDEQRIDDLRSLVEGIATEYAGKFPKTTIDITGKTPAALSVHPQISRALREVIENAIVHSGSAPGVDIHLRSDGDHSAVSITDDGPGIHPEEYEVITGESEITQINHASGLGLWLVYWIVQRSGGDIEFESSESGSTVTIRLPHWKEA
jgi:PAS domain S-box-containing protein